MKLSIIIVNFNTKEFLLHCIKSLFKNYPYHFNSKEYEVIVVDNNSVDGTIKLMSQYYPKVRFIANNVNRGFSAANNQGIQVAQGKYVLFLNPDTSVEKNTLPQMVEYMDGHSQVGISTCKVILPTGDLDDACHRGFPTPWRALTHFLGLGTLLPNSQLFNGYHLGYIDLDKPHEIDACAGAFLLIRKLVGDQVGWFDEDYFWYGEDLDLCFRVKRKGYQIIFVPNVSIAHLKGAASGIKRHSRHLSKIDQETKKQITKARFEVMRIFYKKHYLSLYPQWLTSFVFLGISLKQKLTELTV